MPWTRPLLVVAGFGAALLGGAGLAHADESPGAAPSRSSEATHSVGHSRKPTTAKPARPRPAALAVTRRESATLAGPAPRPEPAAPPTPAFVTAATRWLGEFHEHLTGTPEAHPTAADATSTPYGRLGKWMLTPTGRLADWPSQQYPFATLYQPINLVIIDPTSSTASESAQKVNAALTAATFPAQQIHGTGYRSTIDGVVYGQQPSGTLEAFANAHWLLPNDHGRVFGPAPGPDGAGYVWTASFSREQTGLFYVIPTHVFVSFTKARDAVRAGLLSTGATDLGVIDMDNDLAGRTTTTGDHDGYAVVIRLA
ncbi:hypothetical protein [Mycobacterium sp. shizuoka-1]|uniref:hypothetical protein n=1 Tax=Mycobacterium sp. shizuoka-1 TaxID=2039281 RepID=UPI000C060CE7|nr:hypothetical protein [Mycobacterium sp. shizuoka-1]GAY13275.1 hypothetical protein MSZK_00010 [Mycobacterium sp. shizuoka-1]